MNIDEQIDEYLLSHKKQFSRLSKEGVARIAYLAGFLAKKQDTDEPTACAHRNIIPDLPGFVKCLDCGYTLHTP